MFFILYVLKISKLLAYKKFPANQMTSETIFDIFDTLENVHP